MARSRLHHLWRGHRNASWPESLAFYLVILWVFVNTRQMWQSKIPEVNGGCNRTKNIYKSLIFHRKSTIQFDDFRRRAKPPFGSVISPFIDYSYIKTSIEFGICHCHFWLPKGEGIEGGFKEDLMGIQWDLMAPTNGFIQKRLFSSRFHFWGSIVRGCIENHRGIRNMIELMGYVYASINYLSVISVN